MILSGKCLGSLFCKVKTEEGGDRGSLLMRRNLGALQGNKEPQKKEEQCEDQEGAWEDCSVDKSACSASMKTRVRIPDPM